MSFFTVDDAAEMGELGKSLKKKLKSKIKKVVQVVKKVSPSHAIKQAIMPSKPKAAAQVVEVVQEAAPEPVTVAQPAAMPQPITLDMPMQPSYGAIPAGPVAAPLQIPIAAPAYYSPAPIAAPSYCAPPAYYEDVEIPQDEVDIDFDGGSRAPSLRRRQQEAEDMTEEFLNEQTDPELNETQETTVDGLGLVYRSSPGYRQTSILPRYSKANLIDRATNPRRAAMGRARQVAPPRGIYTRRGPLPRSLPGMSGILPDTKSGNVTLAAAGGIALAMADFLPAKLRPLAKAGAVGALILGAFRLFSGPPSGEKPSATSSRLPGSQTRENALVSGAIILPARDGAAEKNWTGTNYKLQFSVRNRGDAPVTVEVDVEVTEKGRGLASFGGDKVAKRHFTHNDFPQLREIPPGDNVIVTVPDFPVASATGALNTYDAIAKLMIYTVPGRIAFQAGSAAYTIG